MPQHWDTRTCQALDRGRHRCAAFDLDRLSAGLLHQTAACAQQLSKIAMRDGKGNVSDHQCLRLGTRHRRGVVQHHLERHWNRGLEAQLRSANRVAD